MIIKLKRASKETWETKNYILYDGEIGVEKGADGIPAKMKIGNGISNWNDLPYALINKEDLETLTSTYTTKGPIQTNIGFVNETTTFMRASAKKVFDTLFYGSEQVVIQPLSVETNYELEENLMFGETTNITVNVTVTGGVAPYTFDYYRNGVLDTTLEEPTFIYYGMEKEEPLYVIVRDSSNNEVQSEEFIPSFSAPVYVLWDQNGAQHTTGELIIPVLDTSLYNPILLEKNQPIFSENFYSPGIDLSEYKRFCVLYPADWNAIETIQSPDDIYTTSSIRFDEEESEDGSFAAFYNLSEILSQEIMIHDIPYKILFSRVQYPVPQTGFSYTVNFVQ